MQPHFSIFVRYSDTGTAKKKKLCKSNEMENRVVYKSKITWGLVTTNFKHSKSNSLGNSQCEDSSHASINRKCFLYSNFRREQLTTVYIKISYTCREKLLPAV